MGESLKDVVRRAHGMVATADLPLGHEEKVFPSFVAPRHSAWLDLPESQRQWSPEALQFATDVFAGTYKHPRDNRISPSSVGDDCERLLLFGYAGAPKLPFPKPNLEKMDAGTFHHLRWQMEGLSAGYMDAGEVWMHSPSLRCGGSADARLIDGSLFELKTTGGHLWEAIAKGQRYLDEAVRLREVTGKGSAAAYAAGMHAKHKLQMEAYWLVDEVSAHELGQPRQFSDYGSLVYQDPGDPSRIHEVRLHSSESRRKEVHRILEGLHDWIDLNDLPDMLHGCRKAVDGENVTTSEMNVYVRCAYREFCPTATRVRLE